MRRDSTTERAFRRRIKILTLLHQEALPYKDILLALEKEEHLEKSSDENSEMLSKKQFFQFHKDLQALRHIFDIKCDRKKDLYYLTTSPFGLSLDKEQLATLSLLLHTFENKTLPEAQDIYNLCLFLIQKLSPEQQKTATGQRHSLTIEIKEKTDFSKIDPTNRAAIKRAIRNRQQLEFIYASKTGKERHHVIEPQDSKFENEHLYLHGWSIETGSDLHFRVDYILPETAKMLPTTNQKATPRPPLHTLRYHLTPTLARNGVSPHFENQQVEMHKDGSATVTAQTRDLFKAQQIFMRYAEHCIVEEPPALVEKMQIAATHFAQVYLNKWI